MSGLFLDDFPVGRRFSTEPVTLDEEEIVWFAERFDPQPFHVDPAAAAETVFGGLIASGFQTVAAATGQLIRTGIFADSGLGGPGMDDIRWTAPVRPGDTLHTTVEVTQSRAMRSDPGRGVVRLAFSVSTDAGPAASFDATVFVRRRRAEPAAGSPGR